MTLAQIAAFVCGKVNMREANDVAACKEFAKRRFEMIWNDSLWKDAMVMFSSTVDATGSSLSSALWIPSRSTFVCPSMVDRVMAVRTSERHLNVQRHEYYFRIDYDAFSKTGTSSEFVLLPPVVWEFDTAATILLSANEDDSGAVVNLGYLDTDGITPLYSNAVLFDPSNPSQTWGPTLAVLSLTKLATTDPVTLNVGSTVLVTMQAADTTTPRRQRFRLITSPDASTTLRVLAKTRPPQFLNDNDEPQLTNVENSLLAFTHADMLVRGRQYGKASAVAQEASTLLDQLKRIETLQQAHNQRLIPENGYGNEYDLRGNSPLSF